MTETGRVAVAKAGGGSSAEMSFQSLVAKLSAKDRHCVERQIVARESSPVFGLADRWRRIAGTLLNLAPGMVKLGGLHTMQFYIADGKYRKQVFALHALADSAIVICTPDILDAATKAGLLGPKAKGDDSNLHPIGKTEQTLMIDIVSGSTIDPQVFYKDMTGWNRRALYITLAGDSTPGQIRAVEDLCKFAALSWANDPAPPAAVTAKR